MSGLNAILVWGVLPLLFGGGLLAFVRVVRGPSLPDRVVALDLMVLAGISILAVYALITGQSSLLDIAVLMALISFLTVVAFATYVQRSVDRG